MITREDIAMYNPDAVMWDGFDEAIIGMTTNGSVVYDISKIHLLLMANGEMTLDEAIDYAEYNILCAHVGDFTPVHITTLK